MISKFKIVAFSVPIFFITVLIFLIYIIFNFNQLLNNLDGVYSVTIIITFLVIMTFFELRDKLIKINITDNKVLINKYFGILNPISFKHSEITGYYSSEVNTRYKIYNFIYLMKGNKKIAKISNQYHKNFEELKQEIGNKYRDLGKINSDFFSEIKDILS